MKYTVAFIFSRSPADGKLKVLLIRKNRPEWQAGKLNGIGGKLEECDPGAVHGCAREIFEETGLALFFAVLKPVAALQGSSCHINFFAAELPWTLFSLARTMTDEALEIYPVDELPIDVVPNLRWLVPLSLNVLRNDHDGGFVAAM